jgi:hypothetical protein
MKYSGHDNCSISFAYKDITREFKERYWAAIERSGMLAGEFGYRALKDAVEHSERQPAIERTEIPPAPSVKIVAAVPQSTTKTLAMPPPTKRVAGRRAARQ